MEMRNGAGAAVQTAGKEGFGRFFLPGPTEVVAEVLQAQTRPMIGHRGAGITALMERLQTGLKDVFRTARPVFISSSSATGLMEAAARNGVKRKALSLVNGAFSQRFADIVEACGFEAERMEVPWGQVFDPQAVRERLEQGGVDAVTLVHSETSTGALNPLADLAAMVAEFDDVVILVDSVTGVGGAEVQADGWGLDFVLTGSQKALALPPGLAFGVASERMMERAAQAKNTGVYFDLVTFAKNQQKMMTPTTPALSVMYALDVQLGRIARETMEGRWARHGAMRERSCAWVQEMSAEKGVALGLLAPEGHRSPTVTTVTMPEGKSAPPVVGALKDRGFVIGGGYGKLKETTFRIGHMGDHTVEELDAVLGALEEVLVS